MAFPIMLANVSVPLLGAVDTAVVGRLPEAYYIGAVAIGAMLFNTLYHLFNCLRMGTTAPTAQARGAGEFGEVRAIIGRALLLGGAVGGVIVLLQWPIITIALWLIEASAEVEQHARAYFLIRIWSMPAVLAGYAMVGWFYGLGNVRTPLAMQLVANGINIVLDVLFVFGFGWGVPGVALASVIAEYAAMGLGLRAVRRTLRTLPPGGAARRVLDRIALFRLIAINRDIVLRTFCVVSVLALFMSESAALGDVTLAANQVLHQFLIFTSFALDGVAHASEAILGAAAGRRARDEFRQGVRIVLGWAALVGALNVVVYAVAGNQIIALLTVLPEVRAAAGTWLPFAAAMPLLSVWAYTFDGVYLAATRTTIMRNTMFAAFAAFLVVLYGTTPWLGNAGLWAAVATFLGCRGLLLWVCYPPVRDAI
jgi:MATE family multidrug resistance protein